MNIDNLLRDLCPEGVKRVRLGDCCVFQRGSTITAKDAVPGDVPVIAGGQKPAYYHNVANRFGETITVAGSGAYAGFVAYWKQPIYVSDAFTIAPKDGCCSYKYLYYFLKNNQEWIHNTKKGSGVPHVHPSSIDNLLLPLPPLPVQESIVSYLDKLTSLTAELEAELELQKKRYDFYRNRLLSFAPDSDTQFDARQANGDDEHKGYASALVKWRRLGDVFEMRNGYTPSKNNPAFWEGGTIPWFRMEDIRENGRILSDSIQHITPAAVKGKGLFEADSFILATTATIGEHALLIADSLANQQFTNLKIRKSLKNSLLTKFVFYYMFVVDDFCKKHTNKSGFESVDMEALRNMPFPLPSLSEQERIVGILDKYETMVNDTEEGIPALINAVQRKYEYYRERLLDLP